MYFSKLAPIPRNSYSLKLDAKKRRNFLTSNAYFIFITIKTFSFRFIQFCLIYKPVNWLKIMELNLSFCKWSSSLRNPYFVWFDLIIIGLCIRKKKSLMEISLFLCCKPYRWSVDMRCKTARLLLLNKIIQCQAIFTEKRTIGQL